MDPKKEPWLQWTDFCGGNFSFQKAAYCHFWEDKVQWGIAINKLLGIF